MSTTSTSFYVTGGTLQQDAPSYVERQADADLHASLLRGEFCYVLHARQMGKSSLMARTAARLRQRGIAVVTLDLTAIGRNLSPEQWYGGLLDRVGGQLDLEEELEEFWLAHERLGPLQRWMAALREVALARVPGPLVIFVDEIDMVRSLPFSTDEFFAGIRECYNRRSDDPEFGRLTFCLLGVATPSDLIRDTRLTPFNIGRRIELTDFTEAEAAPLAAGLAIASRPPAGRGTSPPDPLPEAGRGSRSLVFRWAARDRQAPLPASGRGRGRGQPLLHRILYWTGGHPYLTQRLCRSVAEDGSVTGPAEVDRLCDELFLAPRARERDDNLLFVRERILRSAVDPASLLDLYAQVRRGKRVADDEASPLVSLLRLSGITRACDGQLQVRNRIYARAFDPAWVETHMPDAERRRQRAAYRRGLARATAVAAVVVAAMGGLALTAVNQTRLAVRQRHLAQAGEQALRHHLYAAQLGQAQQAEEEGKIARARELLEAWRPERGREDPREFAWRYLWRLCQDTARATLPHGLFVNAVAFSPDGKLLASGSGDQTVRLWDTTQNREVARLAGHGDIVNHIAFSPDGKRLASGSDDQTVRLWDVASRQEIATFRGHTGRVVVVAFSPDGKTLASGSEDGAVRLWDIGSRRAIGILTGYTGFWHPLAFSSDGMTLATGSAEGAIQLWQVPGLRPITTFRGHTAETTCLAFSPDGRILASGSRDNTARLWAIAARQETAVLQGHRDTVYGVAFSPDGRRLATCSADATVKLWDLATRQERTTFRGHKDVVWSVAFSPDGKTLASAGNDSTVKLWDSTATGASASRLLQKASAETLAFFPDGRRLACGGVDGAIRLWDTASRRVTTVLRAHRMPVTSLVLSPDGTVLASGSDDGALKLWDVRRRQVVATLSGYRGGSDALAFSADGKTLAMQGSDAVKLWNRDTRRWVGSYPWGGRHSAWGLAFSPDGETLAAVRRSGKVTLWTRGSHGEERSSVNARPAAISLKGLATPPMTFSPDGRLLATRGWADSVKLWDVATKQLVASRAGSGATLQRNGPLAFSPDGKTLAVGAGNTITLVDLASHQVTLTLKGHTGTVWSLAFSPDGNTLASGSTDGTVRLWHAATLPELDPLQVVLRGAADRTVALQWRPVPSAIGYRVYRGPAGVPPQAVARLTAQPVDRVSFTDRGPGLINGRSLTYAVAPVYRQAAGRIEEGPRVTFPAIPAATPPGFVGYSINEGPRSGWVLFDRPTGTLTLFGSGADIWDTADAFYYLCSPVIGDFQLTVEALTRPMTTDVWAQAGPMARETLDPGGRHCMLVVNAAQGLQFKWRTIPNDGTDFGYADLIPTAQLKMPITLRLTRRGSLVFAAYSRDGGRRFQSAGEPYELNPPVPDTLYAGLAITAHNALKTTRATFRGLELRQP